MEDDKKQKKEKPDLPHIEHGFFCWCNPKIVNMGNGNFVIVHNTLKEAKRKDN